MLISGVRKATIYRAGWREKRKELTAWAGLVLCVPGHPQALGRGCDSCQLEFDLESGWGTWEWVTLIPVPVNTSQRPGGVRPGGKKEGSPRPVSPPGQSRGPLCLRLGPASFDRSHLLSSFSACDSAPSRASAPSLAVSLTALSALSPKHIPNLASLSPCTTPV